jgi:membrane-bound metal-dependent hydrolase YbcI (DUF457 family)
MVLFILQSLSPGSDSRPQVVVARLKVRKDSPSLCFTEVFAQMVAFLLLRKRRIPPSWSLCLMWLPALGLSS